MKNRKLLATTALQTGALALFASASPAIAQTTPPTTVQNPPVPEQTTNSTLPETTIPVTQANNATSSPSDQNIVVTGSRIRRPNLESVVPVTSVQGEQFFQKGNTDIGDQLNDLPQLRSTFAQQNPGLGIGIAGLNLLDLRGLSPKRTLVLVNGRRHVAADILSSASVPDINSISADLIDRVDVVTGGNSAVYGSDAVAGVVNFILKRDFDGLQVRGQGSESAGGFGQTYFGSVMYGKNFDGGKGNVTLQAEYNHSDRVFASDIPWYRRQDAFLVTDVDTGLTPSQHGNDAFPDRALFRDVRSTTISRFGLIPISQPSSLAACGTGIGGTNGAPSTIGNVPANNGVPFNCVFAFNPDSTLFTETGTARIGQGPTGSFIGGNGPTTREDRLVSIFPKNERININMLAHYTVSDAFEPFVEAKWVRLKTSGNNAGPSFIQGTGTFDFRERTRLDNPFLTPAQRSQLASAILTSTCNTSLTTACAVTGQPNTLTRTTFTSSVPGTTVNAAFCTANPTNELCQGTSGPLNATDISRINAGTYRFVTARTLIDAGIRDEAFKRDTWRVVGGARGTFNDDWGYEISANYGQFKQNVNAKGFLDRQRFVLSMDAGRNPTTGQIQCRAQFDPASAVQYQTPSSSAVATEQAARLAADIAACVPYNPFGAADNSAAINYFTINSHKSAKMTQFDVLGFVNGDSSQLFELPGGPIGFVVGGEYRRETAFYHEDPFIDLAGGGLTNSVDVGNFDPDAFHVTEAFGELNLPILKDVPLFEELSVSGAGRYSRYQSPIKGVWTYNIGGEWAPIRDIRFRANYGKSVRAPNLSETGFPVVPNFSPTFQDPCSAGQINNNTTRTAACTAALGSLLPSIRNGAYSLGILSGANPNLVPEVSKSLTLGGVLQPRFIPGLSATVDWWDIKVNKVVAAITAQQIVNNCYDLPAGNPFCGVFSRQPAGSTGANGETAGNIVFNTVLSAPLNYAKRVRRGIDLNANYRTRLSSNVSLDTSLIWTHVLKSSNFELSTDPNFENQLLGELGDPKDEGRLDVDLKVGHVTLGYSGRYISKMYINLAEDQIALPSACTTVGNPDTCPPNNADFATPGRFPAITYHSLRAQWDLGALYGLRNINLYAGVDNLFDRHPPLGITATGGGPGGNGNAAIYDVFGRKFFAGFKVRY